MNDTAIDEINELRKENAELKEKLKRFERQQIETAPRGCEDLIVSVDLDTPIAICKAWLAWKESKK